MGYWEYRLDENQNQQIVKSVGNYKFGPIPPSCSNLHNGISCDLSSNRDASLGPNTNMSMYLTPNVDYVTFITHDVSLGCYSGLTQDFNPSSTSRFQFTILVMYLFINSK